MENSFEKIINLYDCARPDYPQRLFEDIISYSGIQPSSKILEIGAGTGQATTFFAEHGYQITALEIGEKQVAYLTQKYKDYPNVSVRKNKFEDFSSDKEFELLVAASSFHWIDQTIRYQKALAMINIGGTLAQFWHMHPVQQFEGDIFCEINKVYETYFKNRKFYKGTEINELIEKRISQLSTCRFKQISFHEYQFGRSYSAHEYISLLATYSYVQLLGAKKKAFLLEIYTIIKKYGGLLCVPTVIHLYLAKKGDSHESKYN